MDLNDVRVLVTVASFAAFLGVVWWAYGARRKRAFEEVARSILDDRDNAQGEGGAEGR